MNKKLMKIYIDIIKKIFFLILFFIFLFKSVFAVENKILFKVNNEIITSIDVIDEIEYLKLINKNLNLLENEKIYEIGKNSIIREKIKTIELAKYFKNFEVNKKYYNSILKNFLNRLNLKNSEELKNYLNKNNIDPQMVEKKLKIEILWNQLIINKYSKDLKVNKDNIRKEILNNNIQKELLLSEIIFILDKNESLDEKYKKIKKEIDNKGFSNAALMYSKSDTTKNGGNIGWIKLNSLNKKIKENLINLKIEEITKPIIVPGGFLILKINEIKKTTIIEDIDKEVEIIANETANKQLNQFAIIYFNKIEKDIKINEY